LNNIFQTNSRAKKVKFTVSFEALHSQARDQQILVFSCRQRAFSQLGGNVLSMSDWSPS